MCYIPLGTFTRSDKITYLRALDTAKTPNCGTNEQEVDVQSAASAQGAQNRFMAYGPLVNVAASALGQLTVSCPAGMTAVSGGSENNPGGNTIPKIVTLDSGNNSTILGGGTTPGPQWRTEVLNEDTSAYNVRAWAECVDSTTVTSGAQSAAPVGHSPTGR
jgi:hypothetical protein